MCILFDIAEIEQRNPLRIRSEFAGRYGPGRTREYWDFRDLRLPLLRTCVAFYLQLPYKARRKRKDTIGV